MKGYHKNNINYKCIKKIQKNKEEKIQCGNKQKLNKQKSKKKRGKIKLHRLYCLKMQKSKNIFR